MIYPRPPVARSCLCNYCSCCVKAVCRRTRKTAHHVSTCFWPGWLEDHFADEVNWDAVADQFSLSLRTLHRQLKQQTGLTPQRYLNRLRLMKARHLLRHSEASVTDIAYRCGLATVTTFRRFFAESLTGHRVIFVRDGMVFCNNANLLNVFVRHIANNQLRSLVPR